MNKIEIKKNITKGDKCEWVISCNDELYYFRMEKDNGEIKCQRDEKSKRKTLHEAVLFNDNCAIMYGVRKRNLETDTTTTVNEYQFLNIEETVTRLYALNHRKQRV